MIRDNDHKFPYTYWNIDSGILIWKFAFDRAPYP